MGIEELKKRRDAETTGFFWLGLYIAFIFGIPAFVAVVIGRKISGSSSINIITVICLFCSFIISWLIVIFIYKKKAKKLELIEDEIRELRKKSDNLK